MPRSHLNDFPPHYLADMHYFYGANRGNASAAAREYNGRFRGRRPEVDYRDILHVSGVFRERGLQLPRSERFFVLTPEIEDEVLDAVYRDPTASVRRIGNQLGLSKTKVWKILKREGLHPYHFTRVQELQENDPRARLAFCSWLLRNSRMNVDFCKSVLWTDEATFNRTGITNHRNLHTWSVENPRLTRPSSFQIQFSINLWAGIIDDLLIGPYVLPPRLTGDNFLEFLQENLAVLLEDVPLATRRVMWLQLDGAPAHYTSVVRQFLDNNYPKWIGRGGRVNWPARSPDLTPLDYYLWGHMKQKVYASVSNTREELMQKIESAAEEIRAEHRVLQRSTENVTLRAQACLQAHGGHFENILN